MNRADSALMDRDLLLAPGRIADLTLPNRMVIAPMTRTSATEDGRATDAMARYYRQFASGGFGLVVTEGIYTDRFYSQGYAHQPGISDGTAGADAAFAMDLRAVEPLPCARAKSMRIGRSFSKWSAGRPSSTWSYH